MDDLWVVDKQPIDFDFQRHHFMLGGDGHDAEIPLWMRVG